jgi:hypothetical protein
MKRITSLLCGAALLAALAGCAGGQGPTQPDIDPEGTEREESDPEAIDEGGVTPAPPDDAEPGRTPAEPDAEPGDT